MTPPTFHQALTAWHMAIKGEKHPPLPPEIICENADVFRNQCAQLAQAKISANKAGLDCQFSKGGTQSGRMYAWITCQGKTLKIVFKAKAKRTQAVTETSLNAYHSTDFSTQEKRIAAFIFLHTKDGGDVTRAEISNRIAVQEGRVSARVNALLKAYGQGGYTTPMGEYRLILVGKRLSKYLGASDKPNEALRFEKCESISNAAQAELF